MNMIWWEDMVLEGERKTLHFLTQVPPLTLDPMESFDIVTRNVVSNLHEGLVTQEPRTLEPQPGIAYSWDVIEPGASYLFYLRTNARFSDGEPILADDIIFSIQRIGQFQGSELVATSGVNPRTVRLDISPPVQGILDHLATPPFSIVSRSVVENYGFAPDHLVSSGPFRLKKLGASSIKHPSIKLLERNPYYWDQKAVRIDQVAYIPIMDADERLRVFQTRYSAAGKRLYYFLNHGPVMRYEELKNNPELQPAPVHATIVLTPNFSVTPLGDVRVRRALSLAISRQRMLTVLPHVQVADALVPRDMRDYPEPRKMLQEDESEARRLMAEAGYPGGQHFPELTLTLFDHDYQERMILYLIEDFKRVLGIKVKCRRLPWSEYLLRLESRDYELLYETWHADVPDPGAFLIPLSTDHPFNTPGYANSEFDHLMLLSLDEVEVQQRTKHYLKAEWLLLDDMAVIPLLYDSHFVMIDEGVKGAHLNKAAVLPLKNIELLS
ncbi:peptide ABC transporter substrate-binding protein [Paenibacillus sp. ClWae2A]|uniref:peptide ABC transporter substrate-binding protein n=1 Tax=Paenibacillus sp. ClWae2A TaxID=3057177 RepID=UPI0028F4F10B|nr:peptide ABC transporter substrate-binding protein [Paenibacillus sp. ClWae2A]MDT9721098.1 peptide ABC transporter substrate-binding protein [Paenibacillus sp. ClWae2A]